MKETSHGNRQIQLEFVDEIEALEVPEPPPADVDEDIEE